MEHLLAALMLVYGVLIVWFVYQFRKENLLKEEL